MIIKNDWMGSWDPAINEPDTTPANFGQLTGTPCLVLAQSTASCTSEGSGYHTVTVKFTAYVNTAAPNNPADWVEKGSATSSVKGQNPSHSAVPTAYIPLTGTSPGQPVCVTAAVDPSTPHGSLGADDYFSIAVAELEQTIQA